MNRFLFRLRRFLWALFDPAHWRFGRYTHYDYRLEFDIGGEVVDASSGSRLSGARVFFVDTGLDEVRSRHPHRWIKFVGTGDASGNIQLVLFYTWGVLQRSVSTPEGNVEIRVERYGYHSSAQTFAVENLPRSDYRVEVRLGTVQLSRR